jgi:hypothetical protein
MTFSGRAGSIRFIVQRDRVTGFVFEPRPVQATLLPERR